MEAGGEEGVTVGRMTVDWTMTEVLELLEGTCEEEYIVWIGDWDAVCRERDY